MLNENDLIIFYNTVILRLFLDQQFFAFSTERVNIFIYTVQDAPYGTLCDG